MVEQCINNALVMHYQCTQTNYDGASGAHVAHMASRWRICVVPPQPCAEADSWTDIRTAKDERSKDTGNALLSDR